MVTHCRSSSRHVSYCAAAWTFLRDPFGLNRQNTVNGIKPGPRSDRRSHQQDTASLTDRTRTRLALACELQACREGSAVKWMLFRLC